jgi:hypothetical protein
MTHVYTLKSGNTFTYPSLFVNPQKAPDVTALWKADGENAIQHIDGIVVNMIDYHAVYNDLSFNQHPIIAPDHRTLREKVRIIDPSYHELLTGTEEQKARMIATGFFDRHVERTIKQISKSDMSPSDKNRKIINDVYPYLHVKPAIEFQIEKNTDFIVSPCVNLTSQKRLSDQVRKAREMLMDSRTLLDTTFKNYSETRDLMNIVTIQKNVIKEANFATLFKLLLSNNPDHVGIRVMGVQESDTVFMAVLFQFLRQFHMYMRLQERGHIPVHLLNVDEIGYAAYCSGICNIVSPIATYPYYKFQHRNSKIDAEERDLSGKYYHPLDMNMPAMSTLDQLPCSCTECRRFMQASRIPLEYKSIFRRMHWLKVKDDEIRQFRETQARLDMALRDKFANSMRPQLAAYIPESPIFAN